MQKISVNEIIKKISEEAAARKAEGTRFSTQDRLYSRTAIKQQTRLYRFVKKAQDKIRKYPFYSVAYNIAYKFKQFIPKNYERIGIGELLRYHDEEFIKNAYQCILGRKPDLRGFHYYLTKLRNGNLSKTEILAHLRYSKEGKENKITLRGLLLPYIMESSYRIPVIGYVLNLMINLIRMPKILRHIGEFEVFTNARFSEQVDKRLELSLQVNQILMEVNGIRSVVDTLYNDKHTRFDDLQQALNLLEKKTQNQGFSILELQNSLRAVFENMRKKLSGTVSEGELRMLHSEEHHLLDALYVAFEDRFRGDRKDIKERVRVYLPYIEKSHSHARDARVLDIGCGRGEWLELLRENGYSAKGIDTNRIMVEQCRDRGLDVVEYEALRFLREQAPGTFSAVTGLHIIEHLPLPGLIQLLDGVLRVLRPGGIAIFETPNSENMIVGATLFHIDPTHGNPVHPLTMDFLLGQRGFSKTEILRLHAMPLQEIGNKTVNDLLFGPQDFAAIGYKQ